MSVEKTLLEKALVSTTRRMQSSLEPDIQVQRIELALAYAQGKITSGQAAIALGMANKSVTAVLANVLLSGLRRGVLHVDWKPSPEVNK